MTMARQKYEDYKICKSGLSNTFSTSYSSTIKSPITGIAAGTPETILMPNNLLGPKAKNIQ